MGEAVDGVQPVKAQVSVVEYPAWSLRYGTQLESERQADIEEFTSTRNLGLVAEVKNPNLFGRALTLGLFGQYEREQQDANVFLATSRLFGWRARSTLYGFYSRDRIRDEEGVELAGDHRPPGRQRRSALALRAACRSSMAIASSATGRSTRSRHQAIVPARLRRQPRPAERRGAVRSPRRSAERAQGHVQLGVMGPLGAVARLRRQESQAARAATHVLFRWLAPGPRVARADRFRVWPRRLLPSDRFHAGGATTCAATAKTAWARARGRGSRKAARR